MTLRPEYSLGHSAYNDFLHAPLGHDASGTELTVLSALARLGLDPWAEAARLADLAPGDAAQALAAILARLPGVGPMRGDPGSEWGGSWTDSEAAAVAERLVVSLPEGSAPAIPPTQEAAATRPSSVQPSVAPASTQRRPPARLATWLLWGSLAVAFYFLIVQMTPDRQFESQIEPRVETSDGSSQQ